MLLKSIKIIFAYLLHGISRLLDLCLLTVCLVIFCDLSSKTENFYPKNDIDRYWTHSAKIAALVLKRLAVSFVWQRVSYQETIVDLYKSKYN